MQHILDDYWEVSTTPVDLGPKSWKTFGMDWVWDDLDADTV